MPKTGPLCVAIFCIMLGCRTEDEEPVVLPVQFNVNMENTSAEGDLVPSIGEPSNIMFAPGILIVHSSEFTLFEANSPASWAGFEDMVEDGANATLIETLEGEDSVMSALSFAALDESYADAPMLPGDKATLSIEAEPGDELTVATMFGESNDVFVAATSIPLFDDAGEAQEVDATSLLRLWDAGTETNEEPGLGDNQAPRQSAAGEGDEENGDVVEIVGTDALGFVYPEPSEMISLRITLAE